jgi:hypothetical protein
MSTDMSVEGDEREGGRIDFCKGRELWALA